MAVKKTPRVVLLDAEPAPTKTEADWSAETTDGWSDETETGVPPPDPALRFHQGATAPAMAAVVDDPNKTAPDEE